MKLDQETVVKHQFWFLLGGYFFIWLIAVLWMKFTYPGEIETLRGNYKKAADGVKSAQSQPVNTATFLPPWEKEAKEFNDHKGTIWKTAWDYQAGMYDWPEELAKKYNMTNPQAPLTQEDRYEYKDKWYPTQIENLKAYAPKWLSPVELKGGFNEIFKPMTRQEWRETPTREEMWLAQEDFWVKRELFLVVWDAMITQALMEPVPIDEKKEAKPEGVEARYRYRNKNWEITLNLRKNDKGNLVIGGDSTIKNIHPSRHPQPLTSAKGRGILFNVAQDNVHTAFEVRGEPVSWNDTKTFSADRGQERKDYDPLSGINWNQDRLKEHPIYVSQGFDQTNSPIRRIDAIELAKQDCRTFVWALQPNKAMESLDAVEEQDSTKSATGAPPSGGMPSGSPSLGPSGGSGPPGGASGGMPSGSGPPMMMGMGGMPGMGGATARPGNKTPNNEIERNRYLQPASEDKKANPPSRHLPLAMQLIVEQAHMHNVLVALANSRLRFQITQVEFHHAKDYVPQSDSDKKDGTDTASPGGGVFAGGPPMNSRMYGGRMPQMPQQAGPNPDMMRQMNSRMQQMQRGMMQPPVPPGAGAGAGPMGSSLARAPGAPRGGYPTMTGGANAKQNESGSTDDNLVELTVYGIATLYRTPDAPPTTEQTSQPASAPPQSGQQPATTAPTPPAGNAAAQPSATTPTQPAPTAPASGNPPPAQKQPDQPANQQKTAPPPTPPAGDKK